MRSLLCNCIAAVWWVLDSLRTMASRPFTASFNRKVEALHPRRFDSTFSGRSGRLWDQLFSRWGSGRIEKLRLMIFEGHRIDG